MKTAGFKKAVAAAGMIMMGLSFTACVEFTSPVCSVDNLEDIGGLEGTKTINTLNEDFSLKQQTVKIDHPSKGNYFGGAVQACRVGSNMVIQSKTEYGTYSVSAVNGGLAGLSFSTLVMGSKELDQAGMKYEIQEREQPKANTLWGQSLSLPALTAQKTKVMVIDNSAPNSRAVIEKYAVPFALGITLK